MTEKVPIEQLSEWNSGNCDRRLIQYGKDQKKVRHSIQGPDLPKHRGGGPHCETDLPRASTTKSDSGAVVAKIRFEYSGESGRGSRAGDGATNRKTPSQGGGVDDDSRSPKKNTVLQSAEQRRESVNHHLKELGSISKSCKRVGLASSTYYYEPKKDSVAKAKEDADVRDRIETVQAEFPFYGYRRIHQ
jgi:hypothetical protein